MYCWKSSEIDQDATATSDEPSNYQELAVTLPKTELPYHNITLKEVKETLRLIFTLHERVKIGNTK